MRKQVATTLAGGLIAYGAVAAQAAAQLHLPAREFSYDYVEGGVVLTEYDRDGLDQDPVGPRIIGSTALSRHVFVRGEASYLTDDIDVTTLAVGPGVRLPAGSAIDLYGVASLVTRDTDPDGGSSESGTGYQVTAGIRHSCPLLDNMAYTWEIDYLDVDTFEDFDDGVVNLTAKGVYALAPQWDAVADLQINDAGDGDELGLVIGGRYNF